MSNVPLKAIAAITGGICIGSGWIVPHWIAPPWVGVVVLVLLSRAQRGRSALAWCWLLGFAGHVTAFHWIPQTVARFSSLPLWIAGVLFVGWASVGALQLGVFGWIVYRLRLRGRGHPTLVAAAWVALAFVWPAVFPWRLAQTQLDWSNLVQIIELTGGAGVGFVMAWVAALAADGACAVWSRSQTRPTILHVCMAGIVLSACLGFGSWRRAQLRAMLASRPELRVGLIQCGDAARREQLHGLSQDIAGEVDLLCWPEAVVGRLAAEREELPLMLRPVPQRRCALVLGALTPPSADNADTRWHNSAVLVAPDESILGRYHKRMLIPFGEYIPGDRWFPSLRRFSAFKNQYRSGGSPDPLDVPGVARLGLLICYEDVVARLARASTVAGANLLVNVTNDRWFGDSHALRQHCQLARLRAIENRRYLLRSTMTGITAIVDPFGDVIAELPTQTPAALVGTVHTLDLHTLYTRYGNAFAWICLMVAGYTLLGRSATNRPEQPSRTRPEQSCDAPSSRRQG